MKNKLILIVTIVTLLFIPKLNFGQNTNKVTTTSLNEKVKTTSDSTVTIVSDIGVLTMGNCTYGCGPDFDKQPKEVANIYPNPFTTTISIKLSEAASIEEAVWTLYTLAGVEVMRISISKQTTNVEISSLSSGMYLYKVISENNVIQSGKLISRL